MIPAVIGRFFFCLLLACLIPLFLQAQHSYQELLKLVSGGYNEKKYAETLPIAIRLENIARIDFGPDSKERRQALNYIGVFNEKTGNYASALRAFNEVVAIYKKTAGGTTQEAYATAVSNLGYTYELAGDYRAAEPLLIEALTIRKQILGAENEYYAASLHNLANLYHSTGNYHAAEPLFNQAAAIRKKLLGPTHPEYVNTISGLALLYQSMGNYAAAEPLLVDVLNTTRIAGGSDHATALNNLASLYTATGNYDAAEHLLQKALEIRQAVFGIEHPQYAIPLNNLAEVYRLKGKHTDALSAYTKVAAIMKKNPGPEHPKYAAALVNLASMHELTNGYAKAEALYLEAADIYERTTGKTHHQYAVLLNNLAQLYTLRGDYYMAVIFYREAAAICEKLLGKNHPNYAIALGNLANTYLLIGIVPEGLRLTGISTRVFINHMKNMYDFLSEDEKEKFALSYMYIFDSSLSTYYRYAHQQPDSAAYHLLNLRLQTSRLILNASKDMRTLIQKSGDTVSLSQYEKWASTRSILANQYNLPANRRMSTSQLDSLHNQANELEKSLVRTSVIFKQNLFHTPVGFTEIRNALQQDEAAIEFISFPYFDGESWTGRTLYLALLIKRDDPFPRMLYLFEENEVKRLLEGRGPSDEAYVSSLYRGTIPSKAPTTALSGELYRLIWDKLDAYLRPGMRVYFTPSGLLHQVAFAAMPDGKGKLLSDKYHLVQLSSSTVLTEKDNSYETYSSLSLFGGINFNHADSTSTGNYRHSTRTGNFIGKGQTWRYLPGTLNEVSTISEIAKKAKLSYKIYTGTNGTEGQFKNLSGRNSPHILHISTHGFFFTDSVSKEENNPLHHAGLVFAGANKIWQTAPSGNQREDGIVTAYEVANLYFGDTRLAVLSACETGLGKLSDSEGVFGLQSAFKMAGVKQLLMSLWKVPDIETGEFMTRFYQRLLSGHSPASAFAEAQNYMKRRYPNDPYKWAAFILVR